MQGLRFLIWSCQNENSNHALLKTVPEDMAYGLHGYDNRGYENCL